MKKQRAKSSGAFTVTSQSYTETASVTAGYAHVTRGGPSGPTASGEAEITRAWDVAWSGTVTGGALSYTTFSDAESWVVDKHWHGYDPTVRWFDRTVDEGWEVEVTGSGTAGTYTGRQWLDDHRHEHVYQSYPGGPPADYYTDVVRDDPLNGSGLLDTTPLYYDLSWNALQSPAVDYVWHGETEVSGTLTETAT
jgi:hypothetical protein